MNRHEISRVGQNLENLVGPEHVVLLEPQRAGFKVVLIVDFLKVGIFRFPLRVNLLVSCVEEETLDYLEVLVVPEVFHGL